MSDNRDRVEKALSKFMDSVPELEGILAFDPAANVVSGQMLVEINQAKLASDVLKLAKNAASISQTLGKGKIVEMVVRSQEGYIVVVGQSGIIICAFTGLDAKRQLALITRELEKTLDNATEEKD
ncbi:MAG: hypothetical protein ACTSUV_03060 [Candidatus Ranarchaeia archaeon]